MQVTIAVICFVIFSVKHDQFLINCGLIASKINEGIKIVRKPFVIDACEKVDFWTVEWTNRRRSWYIDKESKPAWAREPTLTLETKDVDTFC